MGKKNSQKKDSGRHDGIILLKYRLEVSADEQTRRLESRINDPRKTWKLSPDLESCDPLPGLDVELPTRQKAGRYREPKLAARNIPTPF